MKENVEQAVGSRRLHKELQNLNKAGKDLEDQYFSGCSPEVQLCLPGCGQVAETWGDGHRAANQAPSSVLHGRGFQALESSGAPKRLNTYAAARSSLMRTASFRVF